MAATMAISLLCVSSFPAKLLPELGIREPICSSSAKFGSVFHRRRVGAITAAGSGENRPEKEEVPSWAKPNSDEPPPWARQESQNESLKMEFPFYVYLLASAVTAIAAIGSVFEYVNQNPVFGVVYPDNILYAPLLGFFAITGIPSSAFLWFKSVEVANQEAEEQDRKDGFL